MKKQKKEAALPLVEMGGELTVEAPAPEANEYLLEIAKKLKTVKFLILLFLIVFIICMIMFFKTDITLENYQYLVRFITTSDSDYSGDFQSIYFDSNGTTRLGIFHGDLAVLKRDGVYLYNAKGNNTISHSFTYTNPALISSGKYLLTYDLGGNSFDLFNNFSRLTGETFDYEISNAAVSPEGMYAIVTKSLEYQSVIYLYDHNFTLLTKISKDKYIMGIDIAKDASELLVLSTYSENGSFTSEIMTYQPYKEDAKNLVTLEDVLAICGGYHKDNSYSVLCDDSIIFFNKAGQIVSKFVLDGITPTKFLVTDEYTIITYNENIVGSTSSVMVFDNNGHEVYRSVIEDKVLDLAYEYGTLYLLGSEKLFRVSVSSGKSEGADLEAGGSSLFVADINTVFIGYSNMVKPYSIATMFGDTVDTTLAEDSKTVPPEESQAETTVQTTTTASEEISESDDTLPEESDTDTLEESAETEAETTGENPENNADETTKGDEQ